MPQKALILKLREKGRERIIRSIASVSPLSSTCFPLPSFRRSQAIRTASDFGRQKLGGRNFYCLLNALRRSERRRSLSLACLPQSWDGDAKSEAQHRKISEQVGFSVQMATRLLP